MFVSVISRRQCVPAGRFSVPFFKRAIALLAWAAAALLTLAGPASAQTAVTYSNTTVSEPFGAFWQTRCLTRTFSVTAAGQVTSLDIGVLVAHTRRNLLTVTLTSPSGTVRTLSSQNGGQVANLNVLFSDSASQGITSYNNAGADDTSAPPYARTYRPAQSLSGFQGETAAGTWTLEICDQTQWSFWSGTFQRADLTILAQPVADLSLTKQVSNTGPRTGQNVTYTLNLINSAGSSAVSNVTVRDQLPAGTSFVSSSGYGSYDSATGIWTLASVPAGTTRTLSIVANVTASAGAPVTNVAEIASSPARDPDSTPDNGANEDDRAAAAFTVSGTRAAGTPPTLFCPAGSTLFDWNGRSWSAGSQSSNQNLSGFGTVNFALANPGSWLNLDQLGGQTPRLGNAITGGLSPTQPALIQAVDMANRSQVATTTITLPTAFAGAQFRIFDIDYNANQFADRVRVTGSLGGVTVLPTLTNGRTNYVTGNEAFGDTTTADTSGDANIVVTFASPIDKIIVEYGNWSDAPSNPGQQAIAIHDITLCNPNADLSVTKTSKVAADSWRQFAIPGSDIIYTIAVANAGTGTVTGNSLFMVDTMPPDLTFFFGDANGSAPGTTAVIFTDAGSGLTFNYGTDIRFSNAVNPPASFASCTYTPSSQLDASVRHICFNPKGVMAGKQGSASPAFSVSFRARVK